MNAATCAAPTLAPGLAAPPRRRAGPSRAGVGARTRVRQEEPLNAGAWAYVHPRINVSAARTDGASSARPRTVRYVGRLDAPCRRADAGSSTERLLVEGGAGL